MGEWVETSLIDALDLIGGGTPKTSVSEYWNGEIPWLSVVDFNNGKKYVSNTEKSITELGLKNSSTKLLNKGDIIISARGTVGVLAVLDKQMAFNQSCYGIRPKEDIDLDYLYYLLKTSVEGLQQISHGGVFDTITRDTFKEIFFDKPQLPEQKAIAEVLSSLDDKIDLLHRQNKTLESLAETLFRQYFIENAQDDWAEVTLGDFVKLTNGISYKGKELQESDVAMVTLKSFNRNGGFRLDGFKEFTGKFKESHILNEGDIIVAHTDITQGAEVIGNPVRVIKLEKYKTIVFSMDTVKVETISDTISEVFLYFLMKTPDFKEHCIGFSNGSTVLHLSKQAIPMYQFKMPSKNRIDEFSKLATDILEKQVENTKSIIKLEKLRDTLLPKLMNGDVRVEI